MILTYLGLPTAAPGFHAPPDQSDGLSADRPPSGAMNRSSTTAPVRDRVIV